MKLRYSNFADRIDIDALEEALDIEPIDHPTPYEDRCYCPLPWNSHSNGDTTGKFSINREKGVYNCWVCGGGSLLDLAMAMRNEDMEPATKWLYQFANREETDDEFLDELDRLLADPEERQPTMPYFNEHVLTRFADPIEEALEWNGEEKVPFLERRGIARTTAVKFSLRYNATAARPLKDVGYHGPAIYFPHFWRGKLVGWQQRWLDREEDRPRHVPKYTMTPDFPKNETLFGFDHARAYLRLDPKTSIVVVESVPSALFLWSNGQPSVATFGSSVDESQLKLLRMFPHLILAPDNDLPKNPGAVPAGIKWLNLCAGYLERFTRVEALPVLDGAGADIGDLAQTPEILSDYLDLASASWEM